MKVFRLYLNEISQVEPGDKTLRVDEEEGLLTRYNGASGKEQAYNRHKDSYIHDENNLIVDYNSINLNNKKISRG